MLAAQINAVKTLRNNSMPVPRNGILSIPDGARVEFEFDATKSAANRAKHGIDFVEAQSIWNDPDRSHRTLRCRAALDRDRAHSGSHVGCMCHVSP